MKIFNKAKTHFMRKDENGIIVKFDTIENVQTRINRILDGIDKPSMNSLMEFEAGKNFEFKSDPINKNHD